MNQFRLYLYAYSDQNIEAILDFWSKLTEIPREKFTKPYIRSDYREDKKGKMPYGLLHVRYYDKKLLQTIKRWIEEYSVKY